MIQDKIENYKGCTIQHGHFSDRIYLMHIPSRPTPDLCMDLMDLAKKHDYSKIFAKLPEGITASFFDAGFTEEARISGFYEAKETAVFMGFYLNDNRSVEPKISDINKFLKIAKAKSNTNSNLSLDKRFVLRKCNEADVSAMATIYKDVFKTYPFPIHNPNYLLETMQSHVDYFGIETEGKLIAISSAEMDRESANVEMTDFATPMEWRGNQFAQHLLAKMELEMKKKNILTAYTIARAISPGMNITFSKAGYAYCGRLKNNTNISGSIESMNVWSKSLV